MCGVSIVNSGIKEKTLENTTNTKFLTSNQLIKIKEDIMEEIKVCDCGAPLHWTFLYNGQEYFCMNCGAGGGMFGTGKDVLLTVERKARQKVAGDVFKALRKYLFGDGCFTRNKCKKCREGKDTYHTQHTTKYEKAKDNAAQKMLNALHGYFKAKSTK